MSEYRAEAPHPEELPLVPRETNIPEVRNMTPIMCEISI